MSAVLLATQNEASHDLLALADAASPGGVHLLRLDPHLTSAEAARQIRDAAASVGTDVIVLPSSHASKEIAGILAHTLGAGLLIDVSAVLPSPEGLVGAKRELGGTWDVTCRVAGAVIVLAKPARAEAGAISVTEVAAPAVSALGPVVEVLERTEHTDLGASLADASIVVAGGRGLEGDLTPVRELAAVLGAAVGATRDIVEEGWIGHESMVGQTGTMVAPRLYIGAGISGAPHHRLGMQAAEVIVAINTDADAAIMEIADFAVVGDAAAVLSAAAELIRARQA